MRNLISRIIGIVLGSAWTLSAITRGVSSDGGTDAYAGGQIAGAIFGAAFIVAGAYYLRKGLRDHR